MIAFLRRIDPAVWTGLALAGLGLAIILAYAWVEFLNNPGYSLVDGYWVGRVPWVPLGVVLVLGGTALALAAAAAAVLLRGDWVRWLLLLIVLVAPALWWLVALGALPFPRYEAPDPIAFAYSQPQLAALFLILPAIAVAALAFLPMRPDRRVRLKRLHAPDEPPPPRDMG